MVKKQLALSEAFPSVRYYTYASSRGKYHNLQVDCVPTFHERVVPPAGEDHAFTLKHFRKRVTIYVSPTGRSVQVWVNNERVA